MWACSVRSRIRQEPLKGTTTATRPLIALTAAAALAAAESALVSVAPIDFYNAQKNGVIMPGVIGFREVNGDSRTSQR
jgi:hypothetical protein